MANAHGLPAYTCLLGDTLQGRMKGLAFALSPTGYWIEVIRGSVENFTLAQTMIRYATSPLRVEWGASHAPGGDNSPLVAGWRGHRRVKDPAKSVAFYRDLFGMTLVAEKNFPAAKFSLYFMATLPKGARGASVAMPPALSRLTAP